MTLKSEIMKRNADWGLYSWKEKVDKEIGEIFKGADVIDIEINGKAYKKRVWYKYRKISVPRRAMKGKKFFILTKDKGKIKLTIE